MAKKPKKEKVKAVEIWKPEDITISNDQKFGFLNPNLIPNQTYTTSDEDILNFQKLHSAFQSWKDVRERFLDKEELIVLFGFTGRLKNTYSKISETREEINAKITMNSTSAKNIPVYSVLTIEQFEVLKTAMTNTAFTETSFADALAVLRENVVVVNDTYVEPENEEALFDDDCTVECKPGEHKCGK